MRCPYCNHITDDDSMFCASCGRKIEPRGNTYQHTTEMPKMSLYEDDFDMEEERKGKSSSSSVPVIIGNNYCSMSSDYGRSCSMVSFEP